MRTPIDRAWAGVILGLCAAVAGCSNTTAIRPDQLPLLTNAAAEVVLEPHEVIGASGRTVRVDGTLEEVEVTLGPGPGGVKTFSALRCGFRRVASA